MNGGEIAPEHLIKQENTTKVLDKHLSFFGQ